MPVIETIIDDMGKPLEIINIENTVGANGVNNVDDVRIVKALFNYVPIQVEKKDSLNISSSLGYGSSWHIAANKIPSAFDGTMWGVVELTRSFQKYANKMLSNYGYKVNVSGTIKPSKGYALVGKTYSTIAALNIFAAIGARHFQSGYIERIIADSRGDFEYLYDDGENSEN